MDIAYIFRLGGLYDSAELKYSIRSVEKYLKHDNIFLIGDKPDWIRNIIHIPIKDETTTKGYNTGYKIFKLSENEKISENFVVFWDDIYCLKPINEVVNYRGKDTLKSLLNFRKKHNKHWKALNRVLEVFPDAINYDVHHPYLFNKELLNKMFKKYPMDINKVYALHSLYCNEYKIEGKIVRDNKVKSVDAFTEVIKKEPEFFSTSNIIVREPIFLETMQNLFPNKSKYEI